MPLLAGKIAIVIGGASGIGRATALRFAEEGASVVVADLRREPREGGPPVDEAIEAAGGMCRFVPCDATSQDGLEAVFAAADELGGLDVLVHTAGLFQGRALTEIDDAHLDRMLAVGVKAPLLASQAAAQRMLQRGGGSIIHFSSLSGIRGSGGFVVYSAVKGAIRALTSALAEELGPQGIRVNAVAPGMIDTAMLRIDVDTLVRADPAEIARVVPLGRPGRPADVADVAVFLASDLSRYVTGVTLPADGGILRQ